MSDSFQTTSSKSEDKQFTQQVVSTVVLGLLGLGLLFLLLRPLFKSAASKTISDDVTRSITETLMSSAEIASKLNRLG